jgi:hypothetical protein
MLGFVARGIVLAAGLAAGSGSRSDVPQASTLARAVELFAASDSNHDGKLSWDESRSIPVSVDAFGAEDADRDGSWSRDEFLVFYRHQLVATRQPVGADLDAEITRIQALKRVEAVDQTKKPKCETSAKSADAGSVNQRFETMLAEVETKCAARRASRDDFQRLRNLVVLNGRVASRDPGAPTSSSQSALLAAIDRIEKRSAQGQEAKDEFEDLRRSLSTRPEPAPAKPKPLAPTESPKPTTKPSRPVVISPSTGPTAPAPAGPAAARQRPVQPAQPKPQPRPVPPKPASDPPLGTKP